MDKLKSLYKIFEKHISGVKFAVIIISTFAITLVFGTFMESYHGADYANRMVYKSWWFMALEACMFISVFMATVVRLPVQKRLKGFYCIHAGLLILFIGSFFTYVNGIDGSIQLLPNEPATKLLINEDILRIDNLSTRKSFKYTLPYSYKTYKIDKSIDKVEIVEFIPYAENKIEWHSEENHNKKQHSSTYMIFNDNMSQEVTLSLSSKSDFKSVTKMGLLSIHYMPKILKNCFSKETESGFIIWNLSSGVCFTAEERNLPMSKTKKGTRFVVLKNNGKFLKFFPDFSPVAINDDLTKNTNSPFRVLSKKIFESKPTLFAFGDAISFYKKRKKKWLMKEFSKNDGILPLPWMGFKLRLLHFSDSSYPVEIPQYTVPAQESGEIIIGKVKAVKIKFHGKKYFVRSDGPLELSNGKETMRFQITPKEIKLPYQITLDRFQMNVDPGTQKAASFESFVQLLDGRNSQGVKSHHVFMNNPLKYDDFTFYQSSYFPLGKDQAGKQQYGSVLSVNYDPGRFFKYLGCIIVIFGSIWHFIINRKKVKA